MKLRKDIFKPHTIFIVDGVVLRSVRKAMGLKQSDLARQVGCSPQFLCDLENNRRNCSEEVAIKLNRVLS